MSYKYKEVIELEKLIIKTMADGQMFINGVDVGTSNHTQYGLTGDPAFVIVKFVRQSSDKRGNTVGVYNVYNKFSKEDMSALGLLFGGVKPKPEPVEFIDDLLNAYNSNLHKRMRNLFNSNNVTVSDIKDMILELQEEGKYLFVTDQIFKDIRNILLDVEIITVRGA